MATSLTYPLLPYSQLVWKMTRWLPGVYRFPMTFLWRGGAKEKERIEEVFRAVLSNHPVFSSYINWRGYQCRIVPKDILHGQYHDICFEIKGADLYLNISGSRILGDAKSGQILLEDVKRAYAGLPLEPDDYWGYVARYEQQKSGAHYLNSKAWLEREFNDESVPVRPTINRKWIHTFLPPKEGLYMDDYTNLYAPISSLCKEHLLLLEVFFSLCSALAIADYCGTEEAALTWAYEGRERPEEQRIFGSLHRDIPFHIHHKSQIIHHKSNLIRETRNQIRAGIAHSDYPYTLTAPYNKRWDYAVNVLRVSEIEDFQSIASLPVENLSEPYLKYAYAILDVEIHEKAESLQLVYRFSATHYKESSIKKFAALVRKYAEWLLN